MESTLKTLALTSVSGHKVGQHPSHITHLLPQLSFCERCHKGHWKTAAPSASLLEFSMMEATPVCPGGT
jgi:hypothetical protein